MAKTVVTATEAPEAIGPYSQAIASENLVFCSGQIGMDPESGELVSDDVKEQTRRALRNLEAVLTKAGASLGDVVKTTAYLTDIAGDFAHFNEAYAEFFEGEPPARATIGVAGLPKGARVEVECIART